MNKTTSIRLGGQLFHIDELAFTRLDTYLSDLKTHFAEYDAREEILADIEQRLAELFHARITPASPSITLQDVEEVIAQVGTPDQFDDDSEKRPSSSAPRAERKLYRDPDTAVLYGVCSGLAAYLNVDVSIIRSAFVILFIVGLFTVVSSILVGLIYIALAVLLPPANSPKEKMAMHGTEMTLSNIADHVREETANASQHAKKGWHSVQNATTTAANGVMRVAQRSAQFVGTVIRILAGIALTVGSILGIIMSVFAVAMLIFNIQSPYIDTAVRELARGPAYVVGVTSVFFLILFPLIAACMAGVSFLRKKNTFTIPVVIILALLWVASGVTASVVAINQAPHIEQTIREHRAEQTITRAPQPLEKVQRITVHDTLRVRIIQASSTRLLATGDARILERLSVTQQNGELSLAINNGEDHVCIFCQLVPTELVLETPIMPTHIESRNASRVDVAVPIMSPVTLRALDVSRLSAAVQTQTVVLHAQNAARLTVQGSAENSTLTAQDVARIDAYELTSQHATATTRDASRVGLNAMQTLHATARDVSRIEYSGTPTVTSSTTDAAKIYPMTPAPTPSEAYSNQLPDQTQSDPQTPERDSP